MEAIVLLTTTGEMKNIKVNNGEVEKEKKIFRIQVSKTKKPLFFYLNLAKKQLKTDNDVELCALGTAIPTIIIMSEILKRNGWAIQKSIVTSTIEAKEDKEGRVGAPKAKLDILLGKAKSVDQSTDGSAE
ncbi:uncharacterized protein At2g34160-like [Vicia villosa]|uniref:uncharacterized protein At2g34160-like n=1 Tax=Vicia villosa TaxID=3911 RepID=UPI00273CEA65|nr:uncharacterized protein At2g34160-like [Vicia villosa]